MLYIVLSVLCSVSVAALLKLTKKFQIPVEPIVTLNYITALLLSYYLFAPDIQKFSASEIPWHIYIPLVVLLPTVFIFLGMSVKNIGIVKTDIAQRLSLFISILAAYFIFNENIGVLKLSGLAVGFSAIFLTLHKKNKNTSKSNNWLYPCIVFIGFGVIDVFFKKVAQQQQIPFTTSLFYIFSGALSISLLISLFYIIKKSYKLNRKTLYAGILLGLLNFGNIYFYLQAHKSLSQNPSTVFASMNFGVIVLGSLVGVVLFKEKLSKINYIGISLALIAVALITLSQLYV
ncbi:EamA family transporter [Flavobacterium suncheonense]|uniref:Transporter n=1 Tax=Flavobacterium suncheonense GH29-5 = DSM 17707 TaxID=1121899 RepID=A0A0A2MNY8_9FLAO|nr:EamA family transporter [Flavobacterium suncheonense]KGO90005.1 transporter [Flavobacterium suncheonense GH29-5 = DSM 17707]